MSALQRHRQRNTTPLPPVSPSRSIATSVKPDPEANLHEQAGKLPQLWQQFLHSDQYSSSPSTSVLENVIFSLSVVCSILRAHARQPGYLQKQYQLLLAEALQLASLASLHMLNYGAAMQAAKEAERYALQWHEYDLAVSSILRQCQISYYLGTSQVRFVQCKRAADLFQHLRFPLVQSHLLMLMAESQADAGMDEHEHRNIFQTALKLHPSHPDKDVAFPYFQDFQLKTSAARYHIASGDLHAAMTDLGYGSPVIDGSDAFASEAQSILAEIFLDQQNAECAIDAAIGLAQKALALGSPLRYWQAQFLHECLLQASFAQSNNEKLARLASLVVR